MNNITFKCGHCYKQTQAPENLMGKVARCEHCQVSIVVPKQVTDYNNHNTFINLISFILILFSAILFYKVLGIEDRESANLEDVGFMVISASVGMLAGIFIKIKYSKKEKFE
jgi:DNA-directed RNA polymerase subunit RPC12/RpoP